MANVLNRTTLEYRTSVNTPDFPTQTWIINPDLSQVTNTPIKYWKIDEDNVFPMDEEDRTVVDALFLTNSGIEFKKSILQVIAPDPFLGVSGTVVVSGGLNLITNVPNLIFNDLITVTPSLTGTKNVLVSVIYNTASGTFGAIARERVTEEYTVLFDKELLTKDLAEFFVVASGTTLIPL